NSAKIRSTSPRYARLSTIEMVALISAVRAEVTAAESSARLYRSTRMMPATESSPPTTAPISAAKSEIHIRFSPQGNRAALLRGSVQAVNTYETISPQSHCSGATLGKVAIQFRYDDRNSQQGPSEL